MGMPIIQYFSNLRYHILDIVIFGICLFLSFWLRVGLEVFTLYWPIFVKFLFLYLPIRLITFQLAGVYQIFWRFVSAQDSFKIGKAVIVSSVFLLLISYLVDLNGLDRKSVV